LCDKAVGLYPNRLDDELDDDERELVTLGGSSQKVTDLGFLSVVVVIDGVGMVSGVAPGLTGDRGDGGVTIMDNSLWGLLDARSPAGDIEGDEDNELDDEELELVAVEIIGSCDVTESCTSS
jgi:hypothetical protein